VFFLGTASQNGKYLIVKITIFSNSMQPVFGFPIAAWKRVFTFYFNNRNRLKENIFLKN